MKPIDVSSCLVHVEVCTNERPEPKACCKRVGGHELYLALKDRVREASLRDTHWISRTGCLGFCSEKGTTVAIHRQGEPPAWFGDATHDDLETLWSLIAR